MPKNVYNEDRTKRQCSKCKIYLTLDRFTNNKPGVLRSWCKECSAIERRKRKQDRRIDGIRYSAERFGLDPVVMLSSYNEHSGACDLCGCTPKRTRLHIDHDHATGKFRGWLCGTCNAGLGMFKDNPSLMEKAAEYVRNEGVT